MKKYFTFLFLFSVINFANAQTQIQNARVKTRGRMIDGEYVPGKGLPGTVVSIKDITDIGVRNSDGTFSFPVDNNNYFVETVTKNEYVLIDSDAAPKMYNYSEDTLYFVMSMPEQMFEDLLEAKDKIRKTLECEWKNAMAEIKRLKEENRISQEEYLEKLEQLMSNQEKNEDLVNEMAKRYSTLDYDQLDVFYRKVNSYIEEGKLTKADSMLRSRGNVSAQIDAQLKKEESIRHREEEIAKAKSVIMHDKKELEQRCYSYFESFKMQHEYDSAAYYIEQRARIDTLNVEWQFDAGVYFYQQRKYNIAETYMQRSLRLSRDLIKSDDSFVTYVAVSLHNLALLYKDTQRYYEAEQMHKESLEMYREFMKDNPQVYEQDVAMSINALAGLYIDTQRYSEAEHMLKESYEIYRKLSKENSQVYEHDVAIALYNLAFLYVDESRYSEAEQMLKESLEIFRKYSEINPQVCKPYVAQILNSLAGVYCDNQRYSESEQMCEESLEIYRKLSKDNPQVYESDVAMALNNMASLYKNIQRYSDAEQMYEESLEIYRKLSKENPQVYESDVAKALNNMAMLYSDIQRYSEAERMYEESLEIYSELAKDNPQVYESDVAMALNALAILYADTQRYSDAEQMYEESLEIRRKLAKDNPQVYEPDVAAVLNNLAILYSDTQRYSDAEQMYEESLEIYRKLSKENPQVYESYVAKALNALANLYADIQRYSESEQNYKESLRIYQKLAKENPQMYESEFASVLNNLASLYFDMEHYSKCECMCKESLEIRRQLAKDNPQVYEPCVAEALYNLAILYHTIQRYSEAEQMYVESLEIYKRLSNTNPQIYESYCMELIIDLTGLYEEHLVMYKQLLKENKSCEIEIAIICEKLGFLYAMQENYAEAILYYEIVSFIFGEIKDTGEIYFSKYIDILYVLYDLYYKTFDYSKLYKTTEEMLPIIKGMYDREPEQNKEDYSITIGSHSFCCMFNKEFTKAEQYAREGLEIDPTQTFIYTNLASSLLLQGKYNDAEKIYKQYKTELKDSFLSDFEQFEEAGIIPKKYKSDVEKIKQLLNE